MQLVPDPDVTIHSEPYAVDAALNQLGLDRAALEQAVAEGELQRRLASPFDPPTAGGFNAHVAAVRSLRETYVPKGWHPSDDGLSTIGHPNGSVAVAVAAGDRRTGDADATNVSTKRARGPATVEAIRENGQGVLFPLEPTVTWLLLTHVRNDGVYAELSRPAGLDDGFITKWTERIVLGRIDPTEPDGDSMLPETPPAPVDVPVFRRVR